MTPEAPCRYCKHYAFVDELDTVPGGVIRPHASQERQVRARALVPRPGKPYGVPIPQCPGSGQRPGGPLRWPDLTPWKEGQSWPDALLDFT